LPGQRVSTADEFIHFGGCERTRLKAWGALLVISLLLIAPSVYGVESQAPASAASTSLLNGLFAPGAGGLPLASTSYKMQAAFGELALPNNQTTLSSANYRHQPGFLAARGPESKLFLPLVLKDYLAHFDGPFEIEPNNSYTVANGPVYAGRVYSGYPDDNKDYFSVYAPVGGPITVNVGNKTGAGTQLHLYYGPPVAGQYVGYSATLPFSINCTTACAGTGWYYILIYTDANFNTTTAYTVTVTFP